MIRCQNKAKDKKPPEPPPCCEDWFAVEGDLDDFIFYDPAGAEPDPEYRK